MTISYNLQEKGEIGLVAALIRNALDAAGHVNVHRYGGTTAPTLEREARTWLFSHDFDRWVEHTGADPDKVRAGILRECPWLREE